MAQQNNFFDWKNLPPIPDAVGFAGSYAGVSGNALIVGGGANFPDGIGPWGNSRKTWYDRIFVLENADGRWRVAGKLSHPMGYGVSLTWNDLVICVGGSDVARHYSDVWTLQWRDGRLISDSLPSLPKPLANSAGAIVNNTLYLLGGTSAPDARGAEKILFSLDLTLPKDEMTWQTLPSLPGPARMLAVAGSHGESFYVFSGVELYHDDTENKTRRRYLKDGYRFTPERGWEPLDDLPYPVAAAPSPAFTTGHSHLLIFGGDDGKLASKVMELKGDHPGFSSSILEYHTATNTWVEIESVRADLKRIKLPVTTPLVVWDGSVVLPGGEVRPGVRTTQVLYVTSQ